MIIHEGAPACPGRQGHVPGRGSDDGQLYVYTCVWMYMYVCMYVCMCVCMYVCMYVCMWVCMYAYIYI